MVQRASLGCVILQTGFVLRFQDEFAADLAQIVCDGLDAALVRQASAPMSAKLKIALLEIIAIS